MTSPRYPAYLFLLLSFLEGGAVMAAELIGAKMLAPFFGSSLYVWSTVLAVTLGGLAAGYFTGGWLSSKRGTPKTLFICLAVAGMFMAAMPVTSKFIMYRIGFYELIPATIFSSLVFLFPPVFTMGTVSPLIIGNLATDPAQSGKYSGLVYGISTIGGIGATFLTGFWVIPQFGLSVPTFIIGGLLAAVPTVLLFREYKWFPLVVILFFGACIFRYTSRKPSSANITIKYHKEGLLGQLTVADFPVGDSTGKHPPQTERYLTVNRVWQSQFNLDTNNTAIPEYDYLMEMFRATSAQPPHARVLTLGLGGGNFQNQLCDSGYHVDACELDPRMEEIARTYFRLRKNVNVVIDDARHYLRMNRKPYNAVFYDIFKGEHPPEHCFTLEAFREVRNNMMPNAVFAINLWGYYSGERGRGVRSIFATLASAGFNAFTYATGPDENQSNLVLLAFRTDCDPALVAETKSRLKGIPVDLGPLLADAPIQTDEKPALDHLNMQAYRDFRHLYVAYYYTLRRYQQEPPVFY